ncbi:hypothetical protein [Selenomonas sputigena]|uniref:hypothetical protein n=1 Tax=Selenomonas sputigena TaxID=69823 RepID=UPI0022348D71|nr:hypothetical protein [Selenomonas sputigena]UZE45013.1 hypothetical protein OL236_10550 [Selenomonas sputigena]
MRHPIAMMKTCTAALLFAALFLLAQVEPASAALYNGDIGETRFTSLDRWDNQSTYILKRYAKPNGGSSDGTVLVTPEPEQGTYEIVDPTQEAGRWNRSFDYDEKTGVLTLYDDGGPIERWTILSWKGWEPGDVRVEQLIPENSAYDAIYEWQEDRSAHVAYIPGIGERTLPEYILNVIRMFNSMKDLLDEGETYVLGGDANGEYISFVVRKTKKQASAPQASPAVPARYMVIDANDSSEWVAFSYDTATGIFTMYSDSENGADKPYAYRRFIGGGRLEVKSVGGGVHTDVYTPDSSGEYHAGSEWIYRYVTDGMRLFLQKIR